MSNRSFGEFGLREGLRIKDHFAEDTAAERNILVEAQPGKVVADWVLHSGSAYKATVSWPFHRYGETAGANDQFRDVVNVNVTPPAASGKLSQVLAKIESIDQVISTASTFKYDLASQTLYIHLPDNSNPNQSTIFVKFGFFFGSRMSVHPALTTLQAQLLTNGDFESLTGWDEVVTGAGASSLDTVDFIEGTSSLKLDVSAGGTVLRERYITATYRETYRLSGYYKTDTDPGQTGHVTAQVGVAYGASFEVPFWVQTDGRTHNADVNGFSFNLNPTVGEWRRFAFDFVYPSVDTGDTQKLRVRFAAGGDTNQGIVHFDGMEIRHFTRYNLYEPRLSGASIPDYDVGVNDTLSGGHRQGIGSLRLINADGVLEEDLGGLIWLNQGVVVYNTGTFEDDQPTTFDDRRSVFTGRIQNIDASDEEIAVSLEDFQPGSDSLVPSRTVTLVGFPLADPDAVGKPRPLLFGRKTRIIPVKIDATNRIYEICDTTAAYWQTTGIKAVDAVYKYTTEEGANNDDPALRTLLVLTTDYTVDLLNGRITIVDAADDTFIRVDAQGFKDDSLGTYTGTASALISIAPDIARFFQDRIVAQGGTDDASFIAARAASPEPLGIYLREAISTREVYNRIEQSVLAIISIYGDGTLFYTDVSESDPATVADLTENDFMTWSVEKRIRDVYSAVEIRYDQKGNGEFLSTSAQSPSTPVVYRRNDTKVVETYLIQAADATTLATRMLEMVSSAPRRIVANIHGKMLRLRLGQAVTVTRSRGVGPALNLAKFRVAQMRHSFASNITTVELLEAHPGQPAEGSGPSVPAALSMVLADAALSRRRRGRRVEHQHLAFVA